MGHSIQAIVGSKHVLDRVQQRFGTSRVIELSQGLYLLPMLEELYDALPSADDLKFPTEYPQFTFLSPKLVTLLTAASKEGAVAYVETDYFGGLGDQGAIVAKEGNRESSPHAAIAESIRFALVVTVSMRKRSQPNFSRCTPCCHVAS